MPGWLRAKLLEQPENSTVDDLCPVARKQLTKQNLCKTDNYAEGAFSEMSQTVTENLVDALTKLTQKQQVPTFCYRKQHADADRWNFFLFRLENNCQK